MEKLIIELNCTEKTCGNCRLNNGGLNAGYCNVFGKETDSIYENKVIIGYSRLLECIEACKSGVTINMKK